MKEIKITTINQLFDEVEKISKLDFDNSNEKSEPFKGIIEDNSFDFDEFKKCVNLEIPLERFQDKDGDEIIYKLDDNNANNSTNISKTNFGDLYDTNNNDTNTSEGVVNLIIDELSSKINVYFKQLTISVKDCVFEKFLVDLEAELEKFLSTRIWK